MLKRNVGEMTDALKEERKKLFVLEIEDKGNVRKLELDVGQICLEGFREFKGKLIRGVPKRNPEDCFKYCRHEGCQFT